VENSPLALQEAWSSTYSPLSEQRAQPDAEVGN
jgi:hypothetical protein